MTSLMNNPWIPWLFHFMEGFAGTSCVGMASYWMFHWGSDSLRSLLSILSLLVWNLILYGLLRSGSLYEVVICLSCLGVLTFFCFFQSFIEKAIDKQRLTFRQQFVRALLSHLCLVNVIWVMLGAGVSAQSPGWPQGVGLGVAAAFVLTPISISAVRWILLTSKLQPGFDRLFHPQEKPDGEDR